MQEERGPAPELGGPSDSYEVERASATPLAQLEADAPDESEVATTGEPVRGPLADMLGWFLKGVIDGPPADLPLGRMLTRGPKLSAMKRLELYQYAYRARLVECLADDYPAVQYTIGHDEFEALARRYIEAFPSRHPSLNYYGRHFAEFVAKEGDVFLADLARLEWTMVEVVHAAPSPVLSMTMLQELPPDAWDGIRFFRAPSLRFHEFSYPVNKYLRAFRYDEEPTRPEPEWSATAIYRKEFTIWRMDFTKPMAAVLTALLESKTLGEALSVLPDDNEELAHDVMIWFREWVSGGFFEKIDLGVADQADQPD